MNLGNLLQDWGRKIPGHNWLSDSFLGDVVTGGLARGAERNHWSMPFGHDTSSFDDIFGAGASRTHGGRNLARGIGALFGGGALYSALGGGSAASGGAEGLGEAGGGGTGLGAGTGALEGGGMGEASGSPGLGWQDYFRYGRQGSSLLNSMGGMPGMGSQGFSPPYMPPVDNSMILPPPQQPSYSDLPPGLMTMLLAQAFQQQQAPQQDEGPAIRSGGIV